MLILCACIQLIKTVEHVCVCFQPEGDLTVMQLEKKLRLCVETMTKDKQERLKVMKSRMKVDQHLCDALNAIPYYIPSGCVPSDRQLQEIEQHIRDLEVEQVLIFRWDDNVVIIVSVSSDLLHWLL